MLLSFLLSIGTEFELRHYRGQPAAYVAAGNLSRMLTFTGFAVKVRQTRRHCAMLSAADSNAWSRPRVMMATTSCFSASIQNLHSSWLRSNTLGHLTSTSRGGYRCWPSPLFVHHIRKWLVRFRSVSALSRHDGRFARTASAAPDVGDQCIHLCCHLHRGTLSDGARDETAR